MPTTWQFWIDRGGTFTDVVAQHPNGELFTHKLLSDNPEHYQDAAIQGIRDILKLDHDDAFPSEQISAIKMGTTVATNALLERKGERTALLITKGFQDALRIGYQNRPDLFALNIILPEVLYEAVIEVDERYSAQGEELQPVQLALLRPQLQTIYEQGIYSVAIVLLHSYRYPEHELQVAALAKEIGFSQISISHQVSPLQKIVSRGDTTVVDAYLSPILRRYVNQVANQVGDVKLLFMQSNGGLTDAHLFQGKDAILSGPAGGYVGGVKTAALANFHKIINFDMGGTSTDVSHYAGEYEREFETQIAGVRMRVPMMRIHTVAAGGGSICQFDGTRLRVGPDSAGAKPGPACYRRDGPLTVTDCNVMLGKLHGEFFPKVFGKSGKKPLDDKIVKQKFIALAEKVTKAIGKHHTALQVAEGFLKIAVENMASAIKKISVQRGYDITEYTLVCFGGAGGQHACLVADALGLKTIMIHPKAGVLSALGMGLADIRSLKEQTIGLELSDSVILQLTQVLRQLEQLGRMELYQQGVANQCITVQYKVHLRYASTDSSLLVKFADSSAMQEEFMKIHQRRFGFVREDDTPLMVEAASVEVIGNSRSVDISKQAGIISPSTGSIDTVRMIREGKGYSTPVYRRESLTVGHRIQGPAIVIEKTSTTVVEIGWALEITPNYDIVLTRCETIQMNKPLLTTAVDPVMLEIFNSLFMSVAEQMGATLANTAYSVNIKERLDFSCAVFDHQGQLVANAPNMPVHLGSMSDSVQSVMQTFEDRMQSGDVFVLNNPYHGGTHLPDVTVVTPVFEEVNPDEALFYVASRGHHSDIGGISPGSIPAHSHSLDEEGVVIEVFKLVEADHFKEDEIRSLLNSGPWPARNVEQNIADLKAQIAANVTGVQELHKMVHHFSLDVVQTYMQHVQDNAEASVRNLLSVLTPGKFSYALDVGAVIQVNISIDKIHHTAVIDFTGSSPQQDNNFNAPHAVCKAAVLYVFRSLVQDNIPLNYGCLKPLKIIVPENCILNPSYPAAVVAGNVETSGCIVDTLYGALGIMAASQGSMNNFTFGNETYQYYETVCGGSGAGPSFHGTSAVHTHMTNSRLTDPEVLEWRFPVILEMFAIRKGSGGEGRYHGGDGVTRKIRFREALIATILSEHRITAPYGMADGQPGQLGKNWIQRVNGTVEKLPSTAEVQMYPGDVFVIETPGGGGYGEV